MNEGELKAANMLDHRRIRAENAMAACLEATNDQLGATDKAEQLRLAYLELMQLETENNPHIEMDDRDFGHELVQTKLFEELKRYRGKIVEAF